MAAQGGPQPFPPLMNPAMMPPMGNALVTTYNIDKSQFEILNKYNPYTIFIQY